MDKMINFKNSKSQISKQLSNMHAKDIADSLYLYDDLEREMIIQLLPFNVIDNVFIELDAKEAISFFNTLDDVRKKVLLMDLSAADLKPLFEEFDFEDKIRFLSLLNISKKQELERLLKYDEENAASEMRSDYVKVNIDEIVSQATKKIITDSKDDDFIDSIYVVDNNNVLVGIIDLKDLIIARKNEKIESLVNKKYEFVYENEKLGIAIDKITNYDIDAIPVLDLDKRLIGIITAEDVLEEIALDYEANIDKFVAVGEYDEASSPLKRAYQRLPWLLASIVLNLIITLFLAVFESTISVVTALILFQPLILGMAGNIGTQAIAVTILVLHNKTHESKSMRKKHIKKEYLIGIINGLIVGILGFLLSFGFLTLSSFDNAKNISVVLISLTIGLSLFLSMMLSAMFGVLIPIALSKLKIDPAAASGPVISTINDLVALVIYFGLATLIIIPMVS